MGGSSLGRLDGTAIRQRGSEQRQSDHGHAVHQADPLNSGAAFVRWPPRNCAMSDMYKWNRGRSVLHSNARLEVGGKRDKQLATQLIVRGVRVGTAWLNSERNDRRILVGDVVDPATDLEVRQRVVGERQVEVAV